MYGMFIYGNLFADELNNWLIYNAGFKQLQCQIYAYYKYAPDRNKLVVLYYIDECVYWYTSEGLKEWFAGKLGKILHFKFLGYTHWFISINISVFLSRCFQE